ncbi:hypothetical protein BGY98DRAFT_1185560, partial [Russula aff. rugulosa BPL654]
VLSVPSCPALRLSVTLSVCHCIHGDATPGLLLLRSSDSALPEFCRRRIFLFHPSPSQRDVQAVLRKRTAGGGTTCQ